MLSLKKAYNVSLEQWTKVDLIHELKSYGDQAKFIKRAPQRDQSYIKKVPIVSQSKEIK